MFDLALRDEFTDCTGYLFDRHRGVDAVLIEKVDRVDLQPGQAAVNGFSDGLGTTVQARTTAFRIQAKTEFCRDDYLVPERGKGVADELLVDVRPVDLRGVKEGHAALDSSLDHPDAFGVLERSTVSSVQSHAAEAKGRNLHISKYS